MNRLFIAADGDNAGSLVGQAVLMDDLQQLHEISNKIKAGSKAFEDWVISNGGQIISSGGDELTAVMDPQFAERIGEARQKYQEVSGLTCTVGIGNTLSQAGKALIAGKLHGKDMILRYDNDVEDFLNHIQQEHPDNPEAQKMNEHYLDATMGDDVEQAPDEQYDNEFEAIDPEDSVGDGSESDENFLDDNQAMGNEQAGEIMDGDDIDGAIQSPESSMEDDDSDQTDELEPIQDDASDQFQNEDESEIAPGAEGTDQALEAINNEESMGEPIDIPVNPKADSDGEELPPEMKADVAGEEAVSPEQPSQEAQEGDDLDQLSSMLEGSSSLDEIKQRIAQNLEQFKQNKDLLEQVKEQNPDLYQTILGLFQNLIELAKEANGGDEQSNVQPEPVQDAGEENLPKQSG